MTRAVTIRYPDKPIIFIMGPTASGKTALAMELYQKGGYEIISVDSALIYKDMNIGSAKPTQEELVKAPHHLIDFLDPADSYSAANFSADAKQLINEIHERGNVPLLTGGTMLYFKALKDGLAELPESEQRVRDELKLELNEKGIEFLHSQLAEIDPVIAKKLHTTDTQRILRALEVYKVSGKPLSTWHKEQQLDALPNPLLSLALAPQDRSILHQRIAKRFEIMMNDGFLNEVKALYSRGDLNMDMPSIRCVGYRQLWMYLTGDYSIEEAVERGIIATRQLAKRQFTWLRSWPDVQWIDSTNAKEMKKAEEMIVEFVK